MRAGGGKEKGSAFERETGAQLSRWITAGQRKDLFSRNVLSGGRFTGQERKGETLGIPGDLMAAHPLAFDFLRRHVIECKHYADLGFAQFLFDQDRASFLIKTYDHTVNQAIKIDAFAWVIAKQNMKPAILLCPEHSANGLLRFAKRGPRIWHHKLQRGYLYMFLLSDILTRVLPTQYIKFMQE